MRSRTRGYGRCGGYGRGCAGCGVHGGHGCGGSRLHGLTKNMSAVGEGDPPISYFLRGQNYDLLNLDQTYYYVCPSVSDARIYPSSDDIDPAVNDDGELQGAINLTPT